MTYKIQRKINSDINHIKCYIDDILLKIQKKIDDDAYFNTKLILNELIINAVKHGNLDDNTKFLDICINIENKCIIIEVTDEGKGIKYKKKAYGNYDFNDCGRGLMLVEGLSDEFVICGNKVKCVQYLK